MTGGIAPAFAAPKTDPVAPTTTVVAPEPKAPQETPTVAEEPARAAQRRNATQAPDRGGPGNRCGTAETQAPPETQAPATQAPPKTQAPAARRRRRPHRRRRRHRHRTSHGDADACAQADDAPTTAHRRQSHDSGRHPGHQRRTPQAARCSPVTRRAGADDVDRAEPDESRRLPPDVRRHARRVDAAIGRPGGSRPGTEPGPGIERCLVDARPAVRQRRQRRSTRPWCRPASPRPRR